MKTALLILLVILTAGACKNSRNKTVEQETPAGTTATTDVPEAEQPLALKIDTLDAAQVPAQFRRRGDIKFAYRFTDRNGINLLLGAITRPAVERYDDESADPVRASYLYAAQYILAPDSLKLLWDIQDKVDDCEFDVTISFKPGGVYITDLDSNRLTETTLVYQLACRSDVSPAEMKLIMHEAAKKMALRGLGAEPGSQTVYTEKDICCAGQLDNNAIEANGDYQQLWAKYKNENDFNGAPPSFLQFARSKWLAHVHER